MPRSMPRTAAGMHLLSCGLDPEAGVAAAPARERPRLDVEDPRSRERALEVVEELREHPRRARAGQAATGEQRDPVRTSREAEPADAVVVQHPERAGAAIAGGMGAAPAAARVGRAHHLLDPEAHVAAAAHEGAGLGVEEPRTRQDAVEVLEEL